MKLCQEKIDAHHLEMKLIDGGNRRLTPVRRYSHFTSGRQDRFPGAGQGSRLLYSACGIELRQIGVRDEAKMIGGVGSCGRGLCCSTWLSDFEPVSIKMAKVQNLIP